jgi:predicted aspartyl protease
MFITGKLRPDGRPTIGVRLSTDKQLQFRFDAIVDTGFSGFVQVGGQARLTVGLLYHQESTLTEVADGRPCPTFLADGFVCIEGAPFVSGLISVMEGYQGVLLGVQFLRQCGMAMVFGSCGVTFISESDIRPNLEQWYKVTSQSDMRSNTPLESNES